MIVHWDRSRLGLRQIYLLEPGAFWNWCRLPWQGNAALGRFFIVFVCDCCVTRWLFGGVYFAGTQVLFTMMSCSGVALTCKPSSGIGFFGCCARTQGCQVDVRSSFGAISKKNSGARTKTTSKAPSVSGLVQSQTSGSIDFWPFLHCHGKTRFADPSQVVREDFSTGEGLGDPKQSMQQAWQNSFSFDSKDISNRLYYGTGWGNFDRLYSGGSSV